MKKLLTFLVFLPLLALSQGVVNVTNFPEVVTIDGGDWILVSKFGTTARTRNISFSNLVNAIGTSGAGWIPLFNGTGTNTTIYNLYLLGTNGASFTTNGSTKIYASTNNVLDWVVGNTTVFSTTPNYVDFKLPITLLGRAPGYLIDDQNWTGSNHAFGPFVSDATNRFNGPQLFVGSNGFAAEHVLLGRRIEITTNSPNVDWTQNGSTWSTNGNFTSTQNGAPYVGQLYYMRITNSAASAITNTLPFASLSLSASNAAVTSVRIPANQVVEYGFKVNADGTIRLQVAGPDNAALVNLIANGVTNFQPNLTFPSLTISNWNSYDTTNSIRALHLFGTTTSHPTNILAGVGTVSYNANSRIFTTTNGGFSVLKMGDSFTPNSLTNAQGNDQRMVGSIYPGNNAMRVAYDTGGISYTNVPWTYSPASHRHNDNNDHYAAAIDSGGNFVSTDYSGGGSAGAFVWFANGATNFYSLGVPTVSAFGTDGALRLFSTMDGVPLCAILTIHPPEKNIYDAVHIYGNGGLATKFGITSTPGNTTNGIGTLSGTANTHRITFSLANAYIKVFDTITVSGETLHVARVINSTTIDTVEFLQNTYAGAGSWTVNPSQIFINDLNPLVASAFDADGGLTFQYPRRTTWNSSDGTNGWQIAVDSDGSFLVLNQGGNSVVNPFSISHLAPTLSTKIKANGTFALQYGLTNDTGTALEFWGGTGGSNVIHGTLNSTNLASAGTTNVAGVKADGTFVPLSITGVGSTPTFNANQFASAGGTTNIASGAPLTNEVIYANAGNTAATLVGDLIFSPGATYNVGQNTSSGANPAGVFSGKFRSGDGALTSAGVAYGFFSELGTGPIWAGAGDYEIALQQGDEYHFTTTSFYNNNASARSLGTTTKPWRDLTVGGSGVGNQVSITNGSIGAGVAASGTGNLAATNTAVIGPTSLRSSNVFQISLPTGEVNFEFSTNGTLYVKTNVTISGTLNVGNRINLTANNATSETIIGTSSGGINISSSSSSPVELNSTGSIDAKISGSHKWKATSGGVSFGANINATAAADVYGSVRVTNNVTVGNQGFFTNGIASYSTNITAAAANTAGYTNTSGRNQIVNISGTSGTYVFYNRSGLNGQTVAGTILWTNTVVATGVDIHVGANCGFGFSSAVGTVIAVRDE